MLSNQIITFSLVYPIPDARDRAGRLYPRSTLEKAIKDFQPTIISNNALICISPMTGFDPGNNLRHAAAVILSMVLDERLCITAQILDTPQGRYLTSIMPHRQGLFGALVGHGTLSDDLVISEYSISHVVEETPA